ncbi:NUDIX domain-containing protein [Lolliginicoccus levis]|uniref:NUDIX domain-containing protein n=1 Tax=Lolliginicoccus levis TaxID=2919542 RepID=UPI00241C06A0|nr:NUDIX hydrolase [Lolliginicoccus levis]
MTGSDRHDFRVIESRIAYEGAVLALRVDDVAMPGGRTAKREVVEHFGAVAVLALDEDDKLMMVQQYRHPLQERLWELPAGLLDEPGEDPVDAARRELREETGLAASTWQVLIDVAVSPGMSDEVTRVYLAQGIAAVDRPELEHEEADMHTGWIAVDDAVRQVLDGAIVNATAVAGIMALVAARASGSALRPAQAPWPLRSTRLARRRFADGD